MEEEEVQANDENVISDGSYRRTDSNDLFSVKR